MNKISSLAGYNLKNIPSSQKEPCFHRSETNISTTISNLRNGHYCKKNPTVCKIVCPSEIMHDFRRKKIVQFCWEQLLQITNAHNCKKNLKCIQFNIFCLSKKMSCVAKKYKWVSNFRTFADFKEMSCVAKNLNVCPILEFLPI